MDFRPNRLQKALPGMKDIPDWQMKLFDSINCFSRTGASTIVFLDNQGNITHDNLEESYRRKQIKHALHIEFFAPDNNDEAIACWGLIP